LCQRNAHSGWKRFEYILSMWSMMKTDWKKHSLKGLINTSTKNTVTFTSES
jgi:hypothetical protein